MDQDQVLKVLEKEEPKVKEFWTKKGEDENERFLKDYILNKKWLEKGNDLDEEVD